MATLAIPPESGSRMAMIESQLKPCGVINPHTSAAFHTVAREKYVLPGREGLAYADAAQPLGNGRELLMPYAIGLMVERAAFTRADRVLVIGAGSGYAAAIIAELAGEVTALESDAALLARARANLGDNSRVRLVEGPLDAGWADGQPYDAILIDGAVQILPDTIPAQLADGGRLLTLLAEADGVTRAAIGLKAAGPFRLLPFADAPGPVLPGFARAAGFVF